MQKQVADYKNWQTFEGNSSHLPGWIWSKPRKLHAAGQPVMWWFSSNFWEHTLWVIIIVSMRQFPPGPYFQGQRILRISHYDPIHVQLVCTVFLNTLWKSANLTWIHVCLGKNEKSLLRLCNFDWNFKVTCVLPCTASFMQNNLRSEWGLVDICFCLKKKKDKTKTIFLVVCNSCCQDS